MNSGVFDCRIIVIVVQSCENMQYQLVELEKQ